MDTALHTLENVAAFMAIASLKGSVLIMLVLAAQKIFGRFLPAHWRYLLWFTVVLGLVTPVGYKATLLPDVRDQDLATSAEAPAHAPAPAPLENARDEPIGSATEPSRRMAQAPDSGFDTSTFVRSPIQNLATPLSILWLTGVLATVIAIVQAGRRFAGLVRRARPASDDLHALLHACSRLTRCRRPITLLESDEVQAPMIAGQLTPTLLLPAGLPAVLTTAQLRHVFIHELMHLQRGDIAVNWIVAAVQALHWFNPLVWYAFSRMRQDRELACDAATLRHLAPAETADYGRTLLQLNDALPVAPVPAVALGMLHDGSQLHRRILMLGMASSRSALHGVLVAFVALNLAALAFGQPGSRGESIAPDLPAAILTEPQTQLATRTDDESEPEGATPASEPVVTQSAIVAAPLSDTPNTAPERVVEQSSLSATAAPEAASPEPAAESQHASAGAASLAAPATPQTILAAVAVAPEAPPPPEQNPLVPYEGLAEIERLAATLETTNAAKRAFIEKWNEIGNECDARKDRFLGVLSASCQRIRTAQRRGEFFRFAYECYQLNAIHEDLYTDYREAAAARQELRRAQELLSRNESDLAEICNEDTYANEYPAFAKMFDDAESLKYYPHRNANPTRTDRNFASFSDVFFHPEQVGGNTGLGTSGTAYSPSYPNPDTPVGGIFGSGVTPGTDSIIAPMPAQ